jgi:hypothetical protein
MTYDIISRGIDETTGLERRLQFAGEINIITNESDTDNAIFSVKYKKWLVSETGAAVQVEYCYYQESAERAQRWVDQIGTPVIIPAINDYLRENLIL